MSQKSRFWNWIDHRVRIELQDRRFIVGTLIGFDKHLNFVISDAVELRFQKQNGSLREIERPLGLTILRGDNVVSIREEKSPKVIKEQIQLEEMEGPGKVEFEQLQIVEEDQRIPDKVPGIQQILGYELQYKLLFKQSHFMCYELFYLFSFFLIQSKFALLQSTLYGVNQR